MQAEILSLTSEFIAPQPQPELTPAEAASMLLAAGPETPIASPEPYVNLKDVQGAIATEAMRQMSIARADRINREKTGLPPRVHDLR